MTCLAVILVFFLFLSFFLSFLFFFFFFFFAILVDLHVLLTSYKNCEMRKETGSEKVEGVEVFWNGA